MDWNNKVVSVTGAAGFIGANLCHALVAKGANVTALDNFEVGSQAALRSILPAIQLLHCDITKRKDLDSLKSAEVVFHLAAISSPRACVDNFAKAYRVNVEGTMNVLEACSPGSRVIFLSGGIAYGAPLYIPVNEDHPLRGKDPYSLTKIIGECLCWAMMSSRNLKPTVVRNFTTYGPGQSVDYVIPSLIVQGLKERQIEVWNDQPSRDFTYIDDTVSALLQIAETPSLAGEAVNLGSGVEIQIGTLARTISEILGHIPVKSLQKEVVGSRRQSCDNTKLMGATGWVLKIPLREGIEKTVDWFNRHHH